MGEGAEAGDSATRGEDRAHGEQAGGGWVLQLSPFKVAVTAAGALRGAWPQRASAAMPAKCLGRERNKVEFSKWAFTSKATARATLKP